jgi:hypothetical protein
MLRKRQASHPAEREYFRIFRRANWCGGHRAAQPMAVKKPAKKTKAAKNFKGVPVEKVRKKKKPEQADDVDQLTFV